MEICPPWVSRVKNSDGNRKLCSHIVDVGGLHAAELEEDDDDDEDDEDGRDISASNISHLP